MKRAKLEINTKLESLSNNKNLQLTQDSSPKH